MHHDDAKIVTVCLSELCKGGVERKRGSHRESERDQVDHVVL